MNSLQQLGTVKQSYWLDFIRRELLTSGELKRKVQEDGLRGMTSNPTIFEKAISSGSEYDSALKLIAKKAKTREDIFETLAIQDIQKAADILKPVYKSSEGKDGFVSLEVSPLLAYHAKETFEEAKKLWKKVNRPNLMIKIPGTQEGLWAIEEATAIGINVNITLLFSVENYKQVLESYTRGLERRVKKNLPIKKIASVASFFVSRVDSVVDKALDQLIASGSSNKDKAQALLHKAAVANAKVAYLHYQKFIQTPRWDKLVAKGAQVQRLLWASTGTKDSRLADTFYIDELIGIDTVNTMPPQTADAFKDHGRVRSTLTQNIDEATRALASLPELGIDLDQITRKLQSDGVQLFIKSFDDLMQVVGAKRELLLGQHDKKISFSISPIEEKVNQVLATADQDKWIEKIWAKEATLWKTEPGHVKIIQNSLGWLRVPLTVKRNLSLLETVSKDIRKAGFSHILLLGMGGSSLAPEVLRITFGKKTGYPDFAILDSTEPASVIERAKRSKAKKTLYIVASKSGSTTEPNAFFAYFYDLVKKEKGERAGENFIAITDPGTQMESIAKEKMFRHIVLNPSDIGGRYSALSFFGMLPAALMGAPVETLLNRAQMMADACSPKMPAAINPGLKLGITLGTLANLGRNKVTFFLSKEISSFSTWVEQLIAESTGKEGKGILPVEGEEIQAPAVYGNDRVFVSIRVGSKKNPQFEKKLSALQKAGHPVIRIQLDKKEDITAEFFRWEIATAVAGKILNIDPFDQPNVQESKDLTKQFLDRYQQTGSLVVEEPTVKDQGVSLFSLNGSVESSNIKGAILDLVTQIRPGDYVALLAYLTREPKNEALLQEIRHLILKKKKVATTVGFGPRFLHSTGQLHKGGDNSGVFIQLTADDPQDLPVPGQAYSFSILKEAQALGDLSALENKHRRGFRLHFKNAKEGLELIKQILTELI